MRIVVTGGSSFVGAWFCLHAARRHEVFAVYNQTPVQLNGVTPIRCDLRRERDQKRMEGLHPDLVVHLACKIQEKRVANPKEYDPALAARDVNRKMMDGVLALGRPILYSSSTVVHWNADSPYAQSRKDDELRLQQSGLPWAIVRPCAPYGPPLVTHRPRHRESFHTLADLVRRLPAVPVIGDGRYRRQPVHMDDLCGAMLALVEGGLPGRAFDAGGAEALAFDEIIDLLAGAMRRRVRKLHLPKAMFVGVAKFTRDFEPALIATIDSDDVVDPGPLAEATGIRPRSFTEGVRCLA